MNLLTDRRCQRWLIGIVLLVGVIASSCGTKKVDQCREILQTIQQADAQRALGEYDRSAQLADIQLYQTLVNDLASIEISHQPLREHQERLINAYQDLVVATNRYLEASNEEGHLSYRSGDAEAEATVNSIQAEKMQAHNTIDLALGLFYNSCSN